MGVRVVIEFAKMIEILLEDMKDLGWRQLGAGEVLGGGETEDEFAHVAARSADDALLATAVNTLFGGIFKQVL